MTVSNIFFGNLSINNGSYQQQPSTQNRKVQILKIKQLATNALKKINEVLQKKEDKENFSQEMLKIKEIKQKQEDSLQKIIADYRSTSLNIDSLSSRLSAIYFKISCTHCNQERIDEQLSNSDKKVQSIQEKITTTFFECLSTIKQALKSSFQWGWSYIKENTSSVTWVALGSLFACNQL